MNHSGTSKMYRVKARQLDGGWRLSVSETGEMWVHRLTEAMKASRSFIADQTGMDRSLIGIQLQIELDGPLESEKTASIDANLQVQSAQEKAAKAYRKLAKSLNEAGMSGAEIALILGVSRQRVSQLLATG